jgi:O-succinylbenzoate synthase
VALAALPGFTLPGDTSASNRYYAEDVTEPFVLHDGLLTVPTGPGIGIDPLPENLKSMSVNVVELTAG